MSGKKSFLLSTLLFLVTLGGWTLGQSVGLFGASTELSIERIAPSKARLLSVSPGVDPWDLVHGNGENRSLAPDGGPVRVRLDLPPDREILGLGFYGGAKGRLTVQSIVQGDARSIEGLVGFDLSSLAPGWSHLPLPASFAGEALILEWQPDSPGAAMPEVELVAVARPGLRHGSESLLPPNATVLASTPLPQRLGVAEGSGESPAGAFHFHLDTDPSVLSRAFLIWELDAPRDEAEQVGVSRSINGLPSLGAPTGTLVEEIHPGWLRQGWNQVRLTAPQDGSEGLAPGVRLRLAVVPDDGRVLVSGGDLVAPAPSALAATLVDADPATGWTGISDATLPFPRSVELPFRRLAQPNTLEVSLAGRPTGVLWVEAVDERGAPTLARGPVHLATLRSGWNVLSLDAGLPAATRLRLSWQNADPEAGSLAEARVFASPVGPVTRSPRLVLSYPQVEPAPVIDDRVVLRGFLQPYGTAGGNPVVYVDGSHVAGAVHLADGAFEIAVPRGETDRRPVTVEALWPNGIRLVRTIAVEDRDPRNRDDAAKKDGDSDSTEVFRQKVTPGEAAVIEHEGAVLEIPAGAVTEEVEIIVEFLGEDQVAGLDTGMTNVTDVHACYRFGPDGMHFAQPVRITLPYDGRKVPTGHVDDDVQTWFFDEDMGRWLEIERVAVDPAAGTVTSLTDHFTDFVNATLTVPDAPSGTSFEPNSITELAEPDPAAGITLIEAPEANPDGFAVLSLPLDLPPGRRGVAPELALTYNSAAGNGWLGLGWDLSPSAIEVDTRFGVPRYDASNETETYLLDGAFLAPTAHTGGPRQAERIFTRRVEGAFERIIRHGSNPASYWWEVTGKNGTRRIYGRSGAARLDDEHRSGNVFRWNLEQIVDTHGNTVDFTWSTDSGDNGEPWVQTYLQSIQYTGGPGIAPYYQVLFHLDDGSRTDRLSTGRPGFKIYARHRLSHADVLAGGALVRRYLFEYREGDFGKSLLDAVAVTGRDGVTELARHRFDYHRMPTTGDDFDGFAAPESWGGMDGDAGLVLDVATERLDVSGGAHAFVGLAPNAACQGHVGVQGGFNLGFTFSRLELLDLNGDGLMDRLNESGAAELNGFDSNAPDRPGVFGDGFFDGSQTLSSGLDLAFDFGAGLHAPGELGQLGVTWVWSHSQEDRSFADVDGDGFPDLVSAAGGFQVWRNQGPEETRFVRDNGSWNGFSLDGIDLSIPEQEADLREAFSLSDALRQLTLPYSGQVEITGAVAKQEAGGRDGVEVAIHHNGRTVWRRTIDPGDTTSCDPAAANGCEGGLTVNVVAGDRLYFRASSIEDTETDDLLWAPRVTYLTAPSPGCRVLCAPVEVAAEQHADAEPYGAPLYVFDAREDFRLAGLPGGGWAAPARGAVVVSGAVTKQSTADELTAVMRRTRPIGEDDVEVTELRRWPLGANAGNAGETFTVEVEPEDVLTFRLESLTQVDPERVEWLPTVSYEGGIFCQTLEAPRPGQPEPPEVCGALTCDLTEGACSVDGETAVLTPEQATQRVEPLFDVRRALPRGAPTAFWQASETGRRTLHVGRLSGGGPGAVLVQGPHRLLLRRDVGGGLFALSAEIDLTAGEPIFVTFLGDGSGVIASAGGAAVPVNVRLPDTPELADLLGIRDEVLAGGYHGWFYGEWNGDKPFRDSALAKPANDEGDNDYVAGAPRPEGLASLDVGEESLRAPVPGPLWAGSGFDLYLSAEGAKPSRRGMNVVAELERSNGGSGGSGGGPGLIRKTYGNTLGLSASAFGLGGDLSGGFSASQLDFFDVNGDNYPDQVTLAGVRFSDGHGGFETALTDVGLDGDLRRFQDVNVTASIGLGIPYSKKGADGKTKAVTTPMPSVGTGTSLSQTRHDLVDVNGDGLPDRVAMSPGAAEMKVRLNLGYRFGGEESWPLPEWEPSSTDLCQDVLDPFQLENLAEDLLQSELIPLDDPNSLRLTRSAVENVGLAFGPIGGGVGTTMVRTVVDLVDINGDGLPDHVFKDDGDGVGFFRVKLNLGDRWGEERRWRVPAWGTSPGDVFNPVGLFQCLDALTLEGNINANGSIGAPICIPLVPPVPVAGLQIEVSAQVAGSEGGVQLFFDDLDGDGLADHALKKQGDSRVHVKRNQAGKVDLLTTVHRPLGGSIHLTYRRQGNKVDHSNPDHRIDMPDNRWVLAEATLDDGRDNTYTTVWDYFNDAYRDRGERVDYGFAKVRETRPDGSTVTTEYHNQDFYRRHLPIKQTVADAAGRLFVVETFDYDLRPVGPRGDAFFPARVERVTALYEGITTIESPALAKTRVVTLDYDAAGNVIREVDLVDVGSEDDTHATVEYRIDPALHLHLPDHITVRNARGDLLRERSAVYDVRGNLVRLESTLIGGRDPETGAAYTGSRNPVWSLTWDALGSLVSITDPVGYTRDIAYDAPTRTQVTRVEDSFGYVSTIEWDLAFALPTLTTDEAGASIRREHDGFGRLARVFAPDELGSSTPTLAFAYYPDERPASAVVRSHDVTRSDPLDRAAFVDGLGRILQEQKDTEIDQGSGGATRIGRQVSGRIEFDVKGRVAAEGQPVFEAGSFSTPLSRAPPFVDVPQTRPVRNTWDVLDRVVRVRFPQGTETRIDYGIGELEGIRRLLRTRTDAEGKTTRTYFDVTHVVRGIEQSNRIGGVQRQLVTRYGYNAMVELISVTDPGGHVTSLDYDTLGRRILIDSPDAGRTELRYDLNDNLGARIPAHLAERGQQIRQLYSFNRLDRIEYPDTPDVLYTYGEPGASGFRANRLATVTDESGAEERFYTALGEIARTVKTATALNGRSPKGPWATSFERDSLGRLLGITYPDGEVLTYGFDAGGRVRTVEGELRGIRYPYVAHLGYDVFGDRARIVYGNGAESRFTYDPASRFLDRLLTREGDGREIQDLRYSYNRVGSVVALANDVPLPRPSEHGGPTAQSFDYDDLHQLVHAEGEYRYPPNKRTVYTLDQSYDEIGNLTAKRQIHERIQPSGKALVQKKTSFDWTYVYGGPQPHAVTHLGERTYHYDASGNQTGWDHDRSGRRRTVVWTEESRVRSVADNGRTTRFLYAFDGRRTNKAGPHGETTYVNPFFSVRNGAIGSKHVFVDGLRIASQVAQPSLNASPAGPGPEERKRYFFHPDHVGSAHFITDDEGEVYQHLEYFPSGELWVAERSESQRTPYLFSGKEFDEETGLSYFGARYYEPRQGQWISADPIYDRMFAVDRLARPDLTIGPFRLEGQLYAYVGNDPLNFFDPDGLGKFNVKERDKRIAALKKKSLKGVQKKTITKTRLRGALKQFVAIQEPAAARNTLAAVFRRTGKPDVLFFVVSGKSGGKRRPGALELDETVPRQLPFTGGARPRGNDTEIKVFETVLRMTTSSTKGTLTMLSERPECSSCQTAESVFNTKRPNITTKVMDLGGPRPGNGL